jgi:hypothetical protein
MNEPVVRILLAIVLLFIIAGIFLLATGSHLGTLLLIPLGAVVGPFMALAYPFSAMFKLGYIFALVASILSIAMGFKKRNHVLGQALVVLGIVAWLTCGFIGLGTGT